MWQAVVAEGIKDFASGMMYLAKRKQTIEAQGEARKLYYQQRDDERKKFKFDDNLAKRKMNLLKQGLSFDEEMFEEKKTDKLKTLDDKKKETSAYFLFGKATNLLDPRDRLKTRQSIASRF